MFQCPEGLIVYFTLNNAQQNRSNNEQQVSMPRRAHCVFHQEKAKKKRSLEMRKTFQCPEGLIVYFTEMGGI
jgi:hypothetical protein